MRTRAEIEAQLTVYRGQCAEAKAAYDTLNGAVQALEWALAEETNDGRTDEDAAQGLPHAGVGEEGPAQQEPIALRHGRNGARKEAVSDASN